MVKVSEIRKKCKYETCINTSDEEQVILFHSVPLTDEEVKCLESFTKAELGIIAEKMFGMRKEIAE